jgi:UTP--glucose-1-phosphate uridylyltransferase
MENEPHYLVIPAAGLGTRMQAVNPDMPKEMLPVGKKPAIQHAVLEGLLSGIKDIIIIISRQKEIIHQYFEDKKFRQNMFPLATEEMEEINSECSITLLYQKEPLGESDAISLARNIVGNHSVAIIYPDNIYFPIRNESPTPGALKILKSVFRRYRTDVTALMEITDENAPGISNSGRVDLTHVKDNVYRIEKILPKSEGHFVTRFKGELRTCGISISGSHLFEYIKRARDAIKEKEFTDVPVRTLMLKEKGLLGCRLPGTVFDIGNPRGYELCLRYIRKTHS